MNDVVLLQHEFACAVKGAHKQVLVQTSLQSIS